MSAIISVTESPNATQCSFDLQDNCCVATVYLVVLIDIRTKQTRDRSDTCRIELKYECCIDAVNLSVAVGVAPHKRDLTRVQAG